MERAIPSATWTLLILLLASPAVAQQPEPTVQCVEGRDPIFIRDGEHTVGCSIDEPSDEDQFLFYAEEGDVVLIAFSKLSPTFDGRLEIRDPQGDIITSRHCSACDELTRRFEVERTGNYRLNFHERDHDGRTRYTLHLTKLAPSLTPQVITFDTTFEDRIDFITDTDQFTFSSLEGFVPVRLILVRKEEDFDFKVEVQDPDNFTIVNERCDDCDLVVEFDLLAAGDYVVTVSDKDNDAVTEYDIEIQCLGGSCEPFAGDPPLLLPFFEVDPGSTSGMTTFFSVRNGSDERVNVRYRYFSRLGRLEHTEIRFLGPQATRVVDVRSVLDSQGSTTETGFVDISILDNFGNPIADTGVLSGDYFRLDFDGNFASGDLLVNTNRTNSPRQLCNSWTVRFFNGGVFGGGTNFFFYLPEGALGLDGVVYSQDGDVGNSLEIETTRRVIQRNSSELDLGEEFGHVVWTFKDGVLGNISAAYDASGRFSVGTQAVCSDP